jgi:hypothetical protein
MSGRWERGVTQALLEEPRNIAGVAPYLFGLRRYGDVRGRRSDLRWWAHEHDSWSTGCPLSKATAKSIENRAGVSAVLDNDDVPVVRATGRGDSVRGAGVGRRCGWWFARNIHDDDEIIEPQIRPEGSSRGEVGLCELDFAKVKKYHPPIARAARCVRSSDCFREHHPGGPVGGSGKDSGHILKVRVVGAWCGAPLCGGERTDPRIQVLSEGLEVARQHELIPIGMVEIMAIEAEDPSEVEQRND